MSISKVKFLAENVDNILGCGENVDCEGKIKFSSFTDDGDDDVS